MKVRVGDTGYIDDTQVDVVDMTKYIYFLNYPTAISKVVSTYPVLQHSQNRRSLKKNTGQHSDTVFFIHA